MWARIRKLVLERDSYLCQDCGSGPPNEVHHLNGRDDNRLGSLLTLCPPCHIRRHDRLTGQPLAQKWRRMVREAARTLAGEGSASLR